MVRLTVLTCPVAASVLAIAAFAEPVRAAGVPPAITPQLLPRAAGQVTSFAFDPADPSIVFAGTSAPNGGTPSGFIYRSTDGRAPAGLGSHAVRCRSVVCF
jgi:hypothetical protein